MSWRWAAYVIKFAVLVIFNMEFLRSRILRVNFAQILAKNLLYNTVLQRYRIIRFSISTDICFAAVFLILWREELENLFYYAKELY